MADDAASSFGSRLRRARDGDAPALERLVRDERSWLVRVAHRRLPKALLRKVGASDVVQDCLHEAVRSLPALRAEDPSGARAWLRRILENRIRQVRRYFGRDRRDTARERGIPAGSDDGAPIPADETSVTGRVTRRMEMRRLEWVLEQLEARDRDLIGMYYFEDMTYEEISARTSEPSTALRKRVSRIRDKLGRVLILLREEGPRADGPLVELQRRAICLRVLRNWDPARIAAHLGIPEEAVAAWIRGLDRRS